MEMHLSERESEIIGLLKRGLTNKQIAQTFGLSPHTVRDYISDMLRRFGVSCRTALVIAVANVVKPIERSAPECRERRTMVDRRVGPEQSL
jgi:DNA-binding CsgD family transcriptional regulator